MCKIDQNLNNLVINENGWSRLNEIEKLLEVSNKFIKNYIKKIFIKIFF
jgi:transcriptional antiterminator